jgi:hypothetical protein
VSGHRRRLSGRNKQSGNELTGIFHAAFVSHGIGLVGFLVWWMRPLALIANLGMLLATPWLAATTSWMYLQE